MRTPFALPAAMFAATLHAQTIPETTLGGVMVTATRTEQASADVLAPVSVLTRDDIERLQPADMPDLLAHLPGIDLIRSGGPGSSGSVFLRGTNGDHTLILVDGQRIASATQGTANIQFIDPQQIERIEVVRGPRSSLYGADAIGGVIQIFTRRGDGRSSAYIKTGYGTRSSSQLAAGGTGAQGGLRYSAHLSQAFTEGINNTRSHQPPMDDEDAYRNSSVKLHVGYDFGRRARLDIDHLHVRTKNEYDGSSAATQPYAESWLQTTQATLRAPLNHFWYGTLSAGRAFDDGDTFDKLRPATHGDIRTVRDSASWQNDFTLSAAQSLAAGVDYQRDAVDSNTVFRRADGTPVRDRRNIGYFLQYLLTQGPVSAQAALREDDNEDYGSETTGSAALGFALPAQHRFTLSYGTAFKAPTFNQLYFPGFGNAGLQPESSRNRALELRGDYARLQWSLNVFENDIDHLIQNIRVAPGITQAVNVQRARIRGGELSLDARLADWRLSGSLGYSDPRDQATGHVLARRARRSAKLDIDRRFGAWDMGASWRAYDHRYVDAANSVTLGGYGVVDLRGGYSFTSHWSLQLKLSNLFAKKYQLTDGYETERFGAFATVTYRR